MKKMKIHERKFVITGKTIEEFKKEFISIKTTKLQNLESLKDKIFSKNELIKILEKLFFRENEVKLILNLAKQEKYEIFADIQIQPEYEKEIDAKKPKTTDTGYLLGLRGVAKCSLCGKKIKSHVARKGERRYRCSAYIIDGIKCEAKSKSINADYMERIILDKIIETIRKEKVDVESISSLKNLYKKVDEVLSRYIEHIKTFLDHKEFLIPNCIFEKLDSDDNTALKECLNMIEQYNKLRYATSESYELADFLPFIEISYDFVANEGTITFIGILSFLNSVSFVCQKKTN